MLEKGVYQSDTDYIVCGNCQHEFPLSSMASFILHKKFDCDEDMALKAMKCRALACNLCQRKFSSPWRLLRHAKDVHSIHIFDETGSINAETISSCPMSSLRNKDILPLDNLTNSFTLNEIDDLIKTVHSDCSSLHSFDEKPLTTCTPLKSQEAMVKNGHFDMTDRLDSTTHLQSLHYLKEHILHMPASVSTDFGLSMASTDIQKSGNDTSSTAQASSISVPSGNKLVNSINSHESCTLKSSAHCHHSTNDCLISSIPADKLFTGHVHYQNIDAQDHQTFKYLPFFSDAANKNKLTTISTESMNMFVSLSTPALQSSSASDMDSAAMGLPQLSFCTEADQDSLITAIKNCCDNLDCGITLIPGNHEEPKDCCYAVVPKKRKQHMQTKHKTMSSSKGGNDNLETMAELSNAHSPEKDLSMAMLDASNLCFPNISFDSSNNIEPDKCSYLLPPISTYLTPTEDCIEALQHANRGKVDSTSSEGFHPTAESSECSSDTMTDAPSCSQPLSDARCFIFDEFNPVQQASIDVLETACIEINPVSRDSIKCSPESTNNETPKRKRKYPTSRPYKCDMCDKAFNQMIHLNKHKTKHTGIKPFPCPYCNYATAERSHLRVHLRTHTGEKPYKCPFCDYATSQNGTLKTHISRHHKAKSQGEFTDS